MVLQGQPCPARGGGPGGGHGNDQVQGQERLQKAPRGLEPQGVWGRGYHSFHFSVCFRLSLCGLGQRCSLGFLARKLKRLWFSENRHRAVGIRLIRGRTKTRTESPTWQAFLPTRSVWTSPCSCSRQFGKSGGPSAEAGVGRIRGSLLTGLGCGHYPGPLGPGAKKPHQ